MGKKLQDQSKVAVITGAGGTLCSAMAIHLAQHGYKVALIGRTLASLTEVENRIKADGGIAISCTADVSDQEQVQAAAEKIHQQLGPCSVLINGAGGNQADAVTTVNEYTDEELNGTNPELRGFFNLNMKRFMDVVEVNTMGTVIPCFVFARDMVDNQGGSIINFASMNTYRPLSRVPAYALSKAGISNFTQWLAAYLAPANIRVNAIAPGFFLNDRSRKLLLQQDNTYSPRGEHIMDHTPMRRFGEPNDLIGCMDWLIDENSSSFVTGITVPIDGGFLSSSGI